MLRRLVLSTFGLTWLLPTFLLSAAEPQVVIESWSCNLPPSHITGGDKIELYLTLRNLSENQTAYKIRLDVQAPPGITLKRTPRKIRFLRPQASRPLKLEFSVHPGASAGQYPILVIPVVKNQSQFYPSDIALTVAGPQYNLRFTFWGGTYWPDSQELIFKCGVVNEGPDTADPFKIVAKIAGEFWEGPEVQRLAPGEFMQYGPFHYPLQPPEVKDVPIQFQILTPLDRNNADNVTTAWIEIADGPTHFGFGFDQ